MSSDDIDPPIVQRTISAAGAPPVATTGVSSIFAAGGDLPSTPASKPPLTPLNKQLRAPVRNPNGPAAQCLRTLDACGPMTVDKLVEATGLNVTRVRNACVNGVKRGYLERRPGQPGEPCVVYGAKPGAADLIGSAESSEQPQTGFKRWLAKRGEESAEGRVKRERDLPPPAKTAAPAVLDAPEPAARFGMFSDGALRIEVRGLPPLELPPAAARALRTFFTRMHEGLKP